jgi:hypothetical protein
MARMVSGLVMFLTPYSFAKPKDSPGFEQGENAS